MPQSDKQAFSTLTVKSEKFLVECDKWRLLGDLTQLCLKGLAL